MLWDLRATARLIPAISCGAGAGVGVEVVGHGLAPQDWQRARVIATCRQLRDGRISLKQAEAARATRTFGSIFPTVSQ